MSGWLHSALSPAGPLAGRIEGLWWVTFWVAAAVFVAVLVALALAIRSGRSGRAAGLAAASLVKPVSLATGITVIVLIVLLTVTAGTGRAIASFGSDDAMSIEVVGHQWWWTVTYVHSQPSLDVTTANEIHIPTGRPVLVRLAADDVIHSFWIPNLHGKTDLIPGRRNAIWLQADRPGTYYGQCAEFCGAQHAHMAMLVIAETPSAFDAWLAQQRQPAPPPVSDEARHGLAVVESGPCAMCHAIRGTAAGATMGPDLTHVASRLTLAAAMMPNSPDRLRAWLEDPQKLKPGSKMPDPELSPDELDAVLAYMETLR